MLCHSILSFDHPKIGLALTVTGSLCCTSMLQGYLKTLHDRYEEWLGDKENCSEYGDIPVLVRVDSHYNHLISHVHA